MNFKSPLNPPLAKGGEGGIVEGNNKGEEIHSLHFLTRCKTVGLASP